VNSKTTDLVDLFPGLDPFEVLQDLLGVTEIYENGSELMHSCRLNFGMHKNGDSNPSASLNRETLLFNCFTCGGGSIIWLVQNVLDVPREEAFALLKKHASGLVAIPVEKFLDKLNKIFKEEEENVEEVPTYSKKILERWVGISSYLTDRGVSEAVQKEMQTGVDLNRTEVAKLPGGPDYVTVDRVILPHFRRGELIGWVARKMTNVEGVAKYKNSKGFPRGAWLYNLDNCVDMDWVYVVESPMSVLVLKSRGIENVVATFGAKVTIEQINLLRKFSKVVIFMDGDPAGHKATDTLIEGLEKFTRLEVIATPENEDAASLNKIPESMSSFSWLLSKI
jgi:DNA primase